MIIDFKTFEDVNVASRKVALFSFLIGTLILALYFLSHYHGVIYFGLFFISVALIANGFFSILLLNYFFKEKKHRKAVFLSLFLIFLNIPIGFFYLDLGFEIYNHIEVIYE